MSTSSSGTKSPMANAGRSGAAAATPPMRELPHLDWPFFEDRHRAFARELDGWAALNVPQDHASDVDAACRALVRSLGAGGWLAHAVGGTAHGGVADAIDTRSICLARE